MVSYGSGYLKERIGICKIIEIIVCILVLVFLHVHISSSRRHHGYYRDFYGFNEYDEGLFGLSIAGIVFSLLTLVCSCIFGKDIEVVLQWLFILWLAMFIAFLILGILAAVYYSELNFLLSAIFGIIGGVVYLVDTYFSYKDYNPKC